MPLLNRRDFLRLSALATLGMLPLAGTATQNAVRVTLTATPPPTLLPPLTKSMKGLFALMKPNDDAIPDALLASPLIAGVTLQINWSTLQPAQTIVAWDILTGALARVTAAKKVLALRPLAGVGSPAWLYDKSVGVRRFSFTPTSDLYHPLDYGKGVVMPYPWDPKLSDQWSTFVRTLGAQFDGEPGVVRVAVSGPTFEAAETYLPHDSDVMASWKTAGYSLTNIQNAWQRALDAYGSAFKRTPFTLDLNPLPDPLDKSGRTLNGLVPVAVAQYGLQRYPGHFFPAQSDLSDVYPYLPPPLPGPSRPPALYESYEKQAATIYDFLAATAKKSFIGFTTSEVRMSRTADRVKALVDRAKLLNAAYLEVPADWVTDPNNSDALSGLFGAVV